MKINRRDFIRSTALTSVAGAALPLLVKGVAIAQKNARRSPKSFVSFDPQANALLAQMTLEEKIGQMVQAEQSALKDISDIEKYFVGSLLSGGSSDPKAGNSLAN